MLTEGMVTNYLAGWLGTRFGLRSTLIAGLGLQVISLLLLSLLDASWSVTASVVFVMLTQALSGVAKDLTKTSAKSAVKQLANHREGDTLIRWVALLTGSKNAVKGIGFFVGAALLAVAGFKYALMIMATCLFAILAVVVTFKTLELGVVNAKAGLRDVWSASRTVKTLSGARIFLFGARDTWFVVGVPVYLHTALTHSFTFNARQAFFVVGALLALWIIAYGFVQARTPRWFAAARHSPGGAMKIVEQCSILLFIVILILALSVAAFGETALALVPVILLGLLLFAVIFAIISSLHSYLILALTTDARSTMDVGFYYMSNAAGRLLGTLLSGLSYQFGGLALCLTTAAGMVVINWWCTKALIHRHQASNSQLSRA